MPQITKNRAFSYSSIQGTEEEEVAITGGGFCGPLNSSYTGFLLLSYCWNPSLASCQRRNLSVLLELFLICLRIPPASPNVHLEMYYLMNGVMIRFLLFFFFKIDSIEIVIFQMNVCAYVYGFSSHSTFISVPYNFPVSIQVQMCKHLCRGLDTMTPWLFKKLICSFTKRKLVVKTCSKYLKTSWHCLPWIPTPELNLHHRRKDVFLFSLLS